MIADVAGVVLFLGRLQRPGQVELQRLVQLGLGLFGGLCHGTVGLCLVRAGEGRPALPCQRLQKRVLCKEWVASALVCAVSTAFFRSASQEASCFSQTRMSPPAGSTAARAASHGLAGLVLFVKLLQHRVLPAVGQLLLLRRVGLPGSGQGRAAVPQSAKLLQRSCPDRAFWYWS